MALAEGNFTLEHREILLKDRPDALYNISAKGTVPVLHIDSKNIIDESLNIMLWAIENAQLNWLQLDRAKQLDMIKINDNNFKYWLDRYKYSDRYPELTLVDYQNKCKIYLDEYNKMLKGNRFLFGNQIQCIDVAIFPFVRQCAHIDLSWFLNEFIYLNQWFNYITSSTIFISVMKKYDVWNQKDKGLTLIYN